MQVPTIGSQLSKHERICKVRRIHVNATENVGAPCIFLVALDMATGSIITALGCKDGILPFH